MLVKSQEATGLQRQHLSEHIQRIKGQQIFLYFKEFQQNALRSAGDKRTQRKHIQSIAKATQGLLPIKHLQSLLY